MFFLSQLVFKFYNRFKQETVFLIFNKINFFFYMFYRCLINVNVDTIFVRFKLKLSGAEKLSSREKFLLKLVNVHKQLVKNEK